MAKNPETKLWSAVILIAGSVGWVAIFRIPQVVNDTAAVAAANAALEKIQEVQTRSRSADQEITARLRQVKDRVPKFTSANLPTAVYSGSMNAINMQNPQRFPFMTKVFDTGAVVTDQKDWKFVAPSGDIYSFSASFFPDTTDDNPRLSCQFFVMPADAATAKPLGVEGFGIGSCSASATAQMKKNDKVFVEVGLDFRPAHAVGFPLRISGTFLANLLREE